MAPSPPSPPSAPPAAAPTPPARRRPRWPRGVGLLLWLLLIGVLPVLVARQLWLSPDSPRRLLGLVPGLTADGVEGSLAEGRLAVRTLDWQVPGGAGRLHLEGLQWDGLTLGRAPHPQAWFSLGWQRLQVQSLHWQPGPPGPAATPPPSLALPVVIAGAPVSVQALQWADAAPIGPLSARLWLGDAGGRQHRLEDLSLTLPQAQITGRARIDAALPMDVEVALDARSRPPVAAAGGSAGSAAPRASSPAMVSWAAQVQARGPLARLDVRVQLDGQWRPPGAAGRGPSRAAAATQPTRARLQARVEPFAAWPLGELQLDSQALDLASLMPGWPRTRLDVQADIHTEGRDRPVQVKATVRNALPGAWDEGLLPLSRAALQVQADPAHTDRLQVRQADLVLADARGEAGRLTGSGAWRGDALELRLQLQGLLPDRLHRQAVPLQADGQVQARVQGLPVGGTRGQPRLTLQAQLDGRLLDGSGAPVALRLQAEASPSRVQVTQAELSSGPAQAQLTLDAQWQAAGAGSGGGSVGGSVGGSGVGRVAGAGAAGAGPGAWRLRSTGELSRFDPRPWWRDPAHPAWQRGPHRLSGRWTADLLAPADGAAAPGAAGPAAPTADWRRWTGQGQVQLQDSLLAGLPLQGQAQLKLDTTVRSLQAQAELAGNQLRLDGRLADRADHAGDDRGTLQLQADQPAALQPLLALLAEDAPAAAASARAWWPSAGQVRGQAEWQGRWPQLSTQGELTLQGLASPRLKLASGSLQWRASPQLAAPLRLALALRDPQLDQQALQSVSLQVDGSLQQHRLRLQVDSAQKLPVAAETWLGEAGSGTRLEASGQGAVSRPAEGRLRWLLSALALRLGAREAPAGTRPWVQADGLQAELQGRLDSGLQLARLSPGRVQLPSSALRWQTAEWALPAGGGPSRLDIDGELEPIDVAPILARLQPNFGWGGDLLLGGRFEVRARNSLEADVVLERRGGDLLLVDDLGTTQALGISDLRLALTARDGVWQFAQGLAGRSLGNMAGAQVLRLPAGQRWPSASTPLQGVIEASVSNLAIWGTWVPPGWRLGGSLHTTATIGGRLGAPELRGELAAQNVAVRNLLEGINLTDGSVVVQFEGDRATISQGVFRGGDGTVSVSGQATLGAKPSVDLQLQAQRFRLLGRFDRRLIGSGQARLEIDGQQLQLQGALTLDEGLIDVSRTDAPSLDSDVRVERGQARPIDRVAAGAPAPSANARRSVVRLRLNLGERLQLRGRGIDTRLRGEVLVSAAAGKLTLQGTVRGDGGSYAAYGQKLDITRADLQFTGPADDPRLDVRATRPNLDVLVGVAITGTAQNPRVRLFSEPELGEYDKLSWLVLGRSPDGLGRADTALLQRAAAALMTDDGKAPTDQLIESLGLTDFSVRQTEGSVRDTVVSLGRQLSQRWYLGYERSVNATTGTWQLVYRAAQRFTLRAQSGTDNAVDAIWSWRW